MHAIFSKTFTYYLSDEPPGSNRICSTCAISKIVVKNATNMIEHKTCNRHNKPQENITIQTKKTEKIVRSVPAAVEIGGYLKLG